jgi:hypothetical protein
VGEANVGVREVFAGLGRRWYILIIGLALTAGGGWYVYQHTPSDYTARSLVLLLPPVNTVDNTSSNPFLQLGGLELTARVLVATYSGTAFQDEIAARAPDAEVLVSMDESTQGGVIAVDVKDRGEQQTMDLLDDVTGTVSQRLDGLQTEVGVEKKDVVGSMLLAKDTEAKPDYQSLIRILVIVVGGGLVVTGVLALVLDVLLRRRRSGHSAPRSPRRRRRHAQSATETATASDEPDASEPERLVPDEELTVPDGDVAR